MIVLSVMLVLRVSQLTRGHSRPHASHSCQKDLTALPSINARTHLVAQQRISIICKTLSSNVRVTFR